MFARDLYPHPHPRPLPASRDPRHLDILQIFSIRCDGKYFNGWNFYLGILQIQENWAGQKFYNELACVFTAHDASKKCRLKSTSANGWRHFGQLEQRKSSVLFPIQSEKSPDSGFFTCDPTKKCIMPSSLERLRACLHGVGGPRSSGVGFFCFHALGDTKQNKLTPLDRGPPLHVNRVLKG